MNSCQLCCQFTDEYVQLSVARSEEKLPVVAWHTHEVRNRTGVLFSSNMLEQLCNKGWVTLTEDTITIPNRYMAKCQPWELAALALPPALPFHVRIHPRGSLTMGSKFAVGVCFPLPIPTCFVYSNWNNGQGRGQGVLPARPQLQRRYKN